MGLSTESRRPVSDGKRVRYYRLNTLDVVFAQQVLQYRQRQREEREIKRQEEQERHAAYTTTMQAQYGIETDRPSSNLPSTPPNNEDGSNNWGGMDGEDNLGDYWWNMVRYYARLAIERVEHGIDSVKELLSTLTSDERWGVMLEFESVSPDRFAQLLG